MGPDKRIWGKISHPKVLLGRMPQQAEVRVAEDDWTGSTDAVERRKRQNRLHQRKYRKFALEEHMTRHTFSYYITLMHRREKD